MLCFFLFFAVAFGLCPLHTSHNPLNRHGLRLHIVLFQDGYDPFGRDLESLRAWVRQEFPAIDPNKIENSWSMGNVTGFPAWLSREGLHQLRQHGDIRVVKEDTEWQLQTVDPAEEGIVTVAPGSGTPGVTTRQDWGQRAVQQFKLNLSTIPDGLYNTTVISIFGYPESTQSPYDPNSENFTWSWTDPQKLPQINDGHGAIIHVTDTGINAAHQEFFDANGNSRILYNIDCTQAGCPNTTGVGDETGHGTHVAGSAAGLYRGVAYNAKIGAVKIFYGPNNNTTNSIILNAVQAVLDRKVSTLFNILSMSIGGEIDNSGGTDPLIAAVQNAWSKGITVVVAAGNNGSDACGFSPAAGSATPSFGAANTIITVGAVDANRTRADFSNYGACTTIWSPGVKIASAWIGNATNYNTIDGTSMATPLVSGAIALMGTKYPNASPDFTKSVLYHYGSLDSVFDSRSPYHSPFVYAQFANPPKTQEQSPHLQSVEEGLEESLFAIRHHQEERDGWQQGTLPEEHLQEEVVEETLA